jgi:hypothetical protein
VALGWGGVGPVGESFNCLHKPGYYRQGHKILYFNRLPTTTGTKPHKTVFYVAISIHKALVPTTTRTKPHKTVFYVAISIHKALVYISTEE